MSKLDRIDWLAQERIDIPDLTQADYQRNPALKEWTTALSDRIKELKGDDTFEYPSPPAFKPKSHDEILQDMLDEILQDMLAAFQASAGVHDIRPGGVLSTMLSIMAQQMAIMQNMMAQTLIGYPHAIQQTWTYPDGTKSLSAPKDGQVFRCYSANQTKEDCYVWSDKNQNWKWIGAKLLAPVDTPIIIHLGNMDDESKCVCGSEASGSNRHSSWCNKFSPDT